MPPETARVLATASLEMIPEQDALISKLNAQLSSTQGRLAVGGFRRPPDWPEWAVALGRAALALFGVTRAYEDIQPWKSVSEHMAEIAFETALGGALYLIVARASPPRGEAVEVRIVGLPLRPQEERLSIPRSPGYRPPAAPHRSASYHRDCATRRREERPHGDNGRVGALRARFCSTNPKVCLPGVTVKPMMWASKLVQHTAPYAVDGAESLVNDDQVERPRVGGPGCRRR